MTNKIEDAEKKVVKVLTGAAVLSQALQMHVGEHGECDKLTLLGIPLFTRAPDSGNPRLFGRERLEFPRWIRGPRK
jgi:hypothetical protein